VNFSVKRSCGSLVAMLVVIMAACAGPTPPPGGNAGLEISYPLPGQSFAGTVAVAARGVGGAVSDLNFTLGSLGTAATSDDTAYLDTRGLADGDYQLIATGTVAGVKVQDSIGVQVLNDVPATGNVGAAGGSLKTSDGSFATLPPGALATATTVTVSDTTQDDILAEFGVDYEALGVTFLGALTVDTGGAEVALPVAVDLAGWANAVQPGQAVVMFALAPDADGDGIGELTLAANAAATPQGSVITQPVPRSTVYGFAPNSSALSASARGATTSLTPQQSTSARPGQILTVRGRGFNPVSPQSNVVRYGSPSAPSAEALTFAAIVEPDPFDPLQEISFAVPALGADVSAYLHNLSTGYRTDPLTVGIGTLGSGSTAAWQSFVEQVDVAATALNSTRPDLAAARTPGQASWPQPMTRRWPPWPSTARWSRPPTAACWPASTLAALRPLSGASCQDTRLCSTPWPTLRAWPQEPPAPRPTWRCCCW